MENYLIYESALEKSRDELKRKFFEAISGESDKKILIRFWINFCSDSFGMIEPLENWIRRSGEKCKKLGYKIVGEGLCKHAIHKANHQFIMMSDAKMLVDIWNSSYTPTIDSESLLQFPASQFVIKYQNLHEEYISSETPYCQIAVEYEVENISANYGSVLLNHSAKIIGEDITKQINYANKYLRTDAENAKYSRKFIKKFIRIHPSGLENLIEAGKRSLKIYGNFLVDCYKAAKQ